MHEAEVGLTSLGLTPQESPDFSPGRESKYITTPDLKQAQHDMISRIESLYRARSLRTDLGRLQVWVGNDYSFVLTDAIRLAHDLIRLGLAQAICDRESQDQTLTSNQDRLEIALTMIPPPQIREFPHSACRYEICVGVSCSPARLVRENFWLIQDKNAGKPIFVCNRDEAGPLPPGWTKVLSADTSANGNMVLLCTEERAETIWVEKACPDRPALALTQKSASFPTASWAYDFLANKVTKVFSGPNCIRLPSKNHLPEIVLSKENISALIACLKKHFPNRYQQWESWVVYLYPGFVGEVRDSDGVAGLTVQIEGQQIDSEAIPNEMWTTMGLLLLPLLSFSGHFLLIDKPDVYMRPSHLGFVARVLASLPDCQVAIGLSSSEAATEMEMQGWTVLRPYENSSGALNRGQEIAALAKNREVVTGLY